MKLQINGMHCKSCKALIEDILEDLGVSVNSFVFEDDEGRLDITTDKSFEEIKAAIESEGDYIVTQ